ncbi:DUF1761 domain-containing protein [Candidatus Pacearchaeota archaeon]|nr:DUF1761 domain-containing protein [Candidatus Pacearchaeota archaeon]
MAFPDVQVNYLAILVSAIASFVLGWIWYGPLFGKTWMKESGITRQQIAQAKKKGMTAQFSVAFISSLVMAFILAHFVKYASTANYTEAISLVFWLWLGFIATIMLGSILWEGKSFKLYLINTLYHLVSLAIMAMILTAWQ